MNATPPKFSAHAGGALPGSGRPEFGQASASAMSMKWSALHEAAEVLAALAGLATEGTRADLRNFPAMMRDTGGWRRAMAEQAIDDLAAIVEPGIAALLAVNARGISPASAALALWQEFQAARSALLTLIPTAGTLGPRRFT